MSAIKFGGSTNFEGICSECPPVAMGLEKHDGEFCTATIAHLEELSSFLESDEECFISQNDKYRVPIGLTALKRLMHVEFRVSLPGPNWVVADVHSLIPSI